jgi:hypothetical protein
LIAFVLWLVPAAVSADSVTLAWDPSAGATGYTVRWGTSIGSYPNSGDAGNNTTFVINGLTAGATYWTVVQAYNNDGVSDYSTPLQFTVPGTAPVPCTYSISPGSASVPDAGGTGSVNVTTQTGCAWTATSSSAFLTFSNGTGRTGSGSVTYSVAANTATTSRIGTATIAGISFAVSQAAAAVSCTYSISPASASVPDSGGSGSVNVTTQPGCAWSASSGSAFLTFTNATGHTGSGSVTYAVAPNTATSSRIGTATIAGNAFSVSQAAAAPTCSYSINPGAATVGYGTATGVIDVTTQSGCAWSATSSSSFLTFQNGVGRTGSGTLTYSVAANTSTSTRIGTATVAGNAFSVSQAGAVCTYSINPATASVSEGATTGTIDVTTQSNCTWSAASGSSFLTFSNGSNRSGSGSVSYSVTANTGTTARTATATVAGTAFSLTQAMSQANCTYSISPTSKTVTAAAGGGSVTVTTQAGCSWTATSNSAHLNFTNGTDRSGSGTVDYTVAENTGAFRTGTGTIAGRTFTLYQSAPACSFTVDPERSTVPAAAGSLTITVTTQSGCAWTAKPMSTFITIANGTGRTGSGTVDLTIAGNTTTSTRTGIAAIASTTVYVTQEAPGAEAPAPSEPPAGSSPWSSDFDGDGKNDLLLQEASTGAVEAWFLDNATLKGRRLLSENMDADWLLVGRGDFNSDGKPDLVWQNKTDGSIYLWYMNGTTRIGAATPSISRLEDPQWRAVGVGDFNKDGRPDIVWQHAVNGTLSVWQMTGTTVNETVSIVPSGTTDLQWKVVGVADFNGDGNSDLLWRNMGTGDLAAWLMSGAARIVHAPLNPLSVRDQKWQIGAVMDANGDGKPDIVWEHTDGTIMIWHMNGTSRTTYPIIPATVPVGWHLVGPK